MRTMLLLGAVLASSTAHADQCALNSDAIAKRAVALVKPGSRVLEFCEPCHEKTPGKSFLVQTIDVQAGEVVINGKATDLAYLYVATPTGDYHNVGLAVSCNAADVSEWIKGGVPSGPVAARPLPVRPPLPPPPTRATAVDDFAGTWNARITTKFSTCPAGPTSEQATWTIRTTGLAGELDAPDGAYVGTLESANGSSYKATLHHKQRPTGDALQATLLWKDSFFGTLVHGRVVGGSVCVVIQDVFARRQP